MNVIHHVIMTSGSGNYVNPVVITPGMYTLYGLVNEVNARITQTLTSDNFRIQLTHAAQPNLQINEEDAETSKVKTVRMDTIDGSVNGIPASGFVFLAHVGLTPFRNSVLNRLGFTQSQVPVFKTMAELESFPFATIAQYGDMLSNWMVLPRVTGSDDVNLVTKQAKFTGTETYDNVMVQLDLVSGGFQKTLQSGFGDYHVQTRREDILGIVPMNASIGSTVTYTRPSNGYLSQSTNPRMPIDFMKITLTDDNGIPFRHDEHPDFSVVIEFTVVEHVAGINADVKAMNQHKAFLSRHMPMEL